MQETRKYEDWEFKPGETSTWNLFFFKVIVEVSVVSPIFLCGYGLISYFFLGVR